jgi:hypothetical protein
MKHSHAWIFLFLLSLLMSSCYRQDPLVRAAQDLQQSAYDFARSEEEHKQQLNLLELGMSQNEVLKRLGPPATRQSAGASPEESREVWTYNRAMQAPAILTFTNQKLTEIRME